MTGLEIIVLAPLAYGIIHLGKKVVEQRQIIDTQIETLAQQQHALEQAAAAAASSGGGGTVGPMTDGSTFIGRAIMVGSLSIAGALTAYNFYKINHTDRRNGGAGGTSSTLDEDHTSSVETSATTTLLTSSGRETAGTSSETPNAARRFVNPKSRHQPPPSNYAPQEARNEGEECKVCMHNQRDTLVRPCNHFALCWDCAAEIFNNNSINTAVTNSNSRGSCPVCRAPISELQFAYCV